MPHSRFPVTINRRHGDLRVDERGIAFVPASATLDDQLSIELCGWLLEWHDVAGIEPLRRREHALAWNDGVGRASRRVRVHYDRCMRFVTVDVHAPLAELFAAVDAMTAAPAHEAA